MNLPTPCLSCGALTTNRPARCNLHKRTKASTAERGLGSDHRRLAKQVLAEATSCHLCGQPGHKDDPADPLEADHLVPRSKGGQNVLSNYAAAHASCNRSRGNRNLPAAPRRR